MTRTSLGAVAIAMIAFMSSPVAHEHATGIVKERMDGMKVMAKSMKTIGQRIKAGRDLGTIPADAKAMLPTASKIAEWFPADSNQHPSEAKPDIWKNWPDFETKAHALEAELSKLGAIDPRDSKALIAQVRAITRTCSACHEFYREEKKRGE
jgi:cytochrome c556